MKYDFLSIVKVLKILSKIFVFLFNKKILRNIKKLLGIKKNNKLQIKTSKPEVIWKANTLLGEGTLWVPSQSSIFFVDIKKKKF